MEEAQNKNNQHDWNVYVCSKINGKMDSHMDLSKDKKDDTEYKANTVVQSMLDEIQTVYGFDKLRDQKHTNRRRIWLLIIVVGLVVFVYQSTLSLINYFSRPVNMNFEVVNNQSLQFPVVVICNQNTFRLTAAAKNNWYGMLDDMYSRDDLSTFDPDAYGAGNLSLEELYTKTAHRKEDLIVGCEWNKAECSSANFTEIHTDYGICYMFNGPDQEQKYITQTGAGNGLSLILNIEQYEYMAGPHHAAGLKILLHGHQEAPFVEDLGDALPTGMDALVSVQATLTSGLPEPYGKCNQEKGYSKSQCLDMCRTLFADAHCECRHFYMQEIRPGYPPVCTISQFVSCLSQSMESFNVKQHCHCPEGCESKSYTTAITYASTPLRNVFINSVNDTELAASYLNAREVAQKVFPDIVEADRTMVSTVLHTFQVIEDSMTEVMSAIDLLDKAKTHMIEDILPRIWFHYTWAIERVLYVMQYNFVRLWDVVDERTFVHVLTGFYQTTELFRDMVQKSINETDENRRHSWYEMTDRELQRELLLCERAFANLTTIDAGFSNGTQAFSYQSSPNRHYDESYIPYDLLSPSDRKQFYYSRWGGYLLSAIEEIQRLQEINREVYLNRTYNPKILQDALLTYEQRGRNHLYYRYNYHSRIVLPDLDKVQDKVDNFLNMNESLFSDVEHLQNSFNTIQALISEFNDTSGANIAEGIDIAENYLEDDDWKKYVVADFVNKEKVVNDLAAFDVLFKDLRTRALQAVDNLHELERNVQTMWKTMIEEPWTMAFYKAVHLDFQNYTASNNDYLKEIWDDMLGRSIDNLTLADLSELISADYHTMNNSSMHKELTKHFVRAMEENHLVDIIGDDAELFLKAFEDMQTALAKYLQTIELDSQFYSNNFLRLNIFTKELVYSHMKFTPAYDIIALLSDIGGTLSLYIGASVITIFEVADALFMYVVKKRRA